MPTQSHAIIPHLSICGILLFLIDAPPEFASNGTWAAILETGFRSRTLACGACHTPLLFCWQLCGGGNMPCYAGSPFCMNCFFNRLNRAYPQELIMNLLSKLSIAALTAATIALPAAAADASADAAKCAAKCAPAKVEKKHKAAKKAKCAAKCGAAKCAPKCAAKCAAKCAPKCAAKCAAKK